MCMCLKVIKYLTFAVAADFLLILVVLFALQMMTVCSVVILANLIFLNFSPHLHFLACTCNHPCSHYEDDIHVSHEPNFHDCTVLGLLRPSIHFDRLTVTRKTG